MGEMGEIGDSFVFCDKNSVISVDLSVSVEKGENHDCQSIL